jgi:hypothetical protein
VVEYIDWGNFPVGFGDAETDDLGGDGGEVNVAIGVAGHGAGELAEAAASGAEDVTAVV